MRLIIPRDAPRWLYGIIRRIENGFNYPADHPFQIQTFTVATLPDPVEWPAGLIYISDEAGGTVVAFSDGGAWRRVTDRAIVS